MVVPSHDMFMNYSP